MTTYYVTQEQLDLIESLNDEAYPLLSLAMNTFAYGSDFEEKFDPNVLFTDEFIGDNTIALTKYLGGDETIEFKVKEPLYRLYLVDVLGQRNYFTISNATALPDRTVVKEKAFVETLEEIKKWKTPAWEIEEVEIQ